LLPKRLASLVGWRVADDCGAKAALGRSVKASVGDKAVLDSTNFDFRGPKSYLCPMKDIGPTSADIDVAKALLKRELEKGLASGTGKRTPQQIREAFRKAREAA
jgi:hypothetical protein